MKRIASILTGLSFAVLFFVASAHAESGQRMTANIPFEFNVGNTPLPAGQYEFIRNDNDIYQIRDAAGRSLFALASTSIQANEVPGKSALKFATVDGRHVLIQIWNQRADIGNGFYRGQSYMEQPTVHGLSQAAAN
jgi:hypothetical protein